MQRKRQQIHIRWQCQKGQTNFQIPQCESDTSVHNRGSEERWRQERDRSPSYG